MIYERKWDVFAAGWFQFFWNTRLHCFTRRHNLLCMKNECRVKDILPVGKSSPPCSRRPALHSKNETY